MRKKITLFTIMTFFLLSSFAQSKDAEAPDYHPVFERSGLGLLVKVQGTYGFLLKPNIQEKGYPEEELTEGGLGFSGQVLYCRKRVPGHGPFRWVGVLAVGVEASYLQFWKDEFTDPDSGIKREIGLSAVPILGLVRMMAVPEALAPQPFHYFQFGMGVCPVIRKSIVSGREVKRTETKFGIMATVGILVPIVYEQLPAIYLDVGWKWYRIYGAAIMSNPGFGILIVF